MDRRTPPARLRSFGEVSPGRSADADRLASTGWSGRTATRPWRRRTRIASGFTLIEIIIAVAAIILLASTLTPIALSWIDEGKAAGAQGDAAAIAAAMNRFFQDTTRWPGQVEILEESSTIRFLTVGDPSATTFPEIVGSVGISAATCVNGLSGVKANVTAFEEATPSPSNSLDVIDFLVRPPSAADYPTWKGPYLAVERTSDPWGVVFVINVIPLFCGETVDADNPGGALGFGWILSGGPNRTLQTLFTASRVAADTDDVGVTLSKRAVQAAAP